MTIRIKKMAVRSFLARSLRGCVGTLRRTNFSAGLSKLDIAAQGQVASLWLSTGSQKRGLSAEGWSPLPPQLRGAGGSPHGVASTSHQAADSRILEVEIPRNGERSRVQNALEPTGHQNISAIVTSRQRQRGKKHKQHFQPQEEEEGEKYSNTPFPSGNVSCTHSEGGVPCIPAIRSYTDEIPQPVPFLVE